MKRYGMTVLLLSIMLLLAAKGLTFAQDNNDRLLKVRVDKSLVVPGSVLEPGDYNFRLVDQAGGPFLVQISKADGSENCGFFSVIPAKRESAGESEVDVEHPGNRSVGMISDFFFPGESDGYAFVYSKKELQRAEVMAKNDEVKSPNGD